MDKNNVSHELFLELRSEIDALRNELTELRTANQFLRTEVEVEWKGTADHLRHIYFYLKSLEGREDKIFKSMTDEIAALQTSLWPIEEKTFPGVKRARGQVFDEIMSRLRPPEPGASMDGDNQ